MIRNTLINKLSRKVAIASMAVASFLLGSCSPPVSMPENSEKPVDILEKMNNPPMISSSPVIQVEENVDYRYQVVATDEDNDELSYSLKNSPEWLSVNEDGLVRGTAPSVDDDDKVRVEVVVSDGKDPVSQSYDLFVRDVDETTGVPETNNPPMITSSPVIQVEENVDYGYQVVATDEDNDELSYSLKNSPEWLSVNEDGLVRGTAPSVDDDDKVRVEVVVSDGKDSVSQSYDLFVKDVDEPIDPNATTIQGRLQDSETDTGSEGEVRAYKENSDGTYTLLDKDKTDADGRFTLSFNEKVPNFDLQARLMDGNVDKSYVRTINLPGENNSDFLVRAVPYTGLNGNTVETDISVEQFQNFIYDAVADEDEGITKWNLDNLEGIEVIDDNPTSNTGYFTQEELNFIEGVLTDKNDGRIYFNGRNVLVQIDSPSTPDSEKHYEIKDYGEGDDIAPDEGWVVVAPEDDIFGLGHALLPGYDENGYRIRGFIGLETKEPEEGLGDFMSGPRTLSHELGHIAFYYGGREFPSHSSTIRMSQSIISIRHRIGETGCTKPCFADRKVGKMMYEDTFATKTPAGNIVGLEWRD